MYSAESGGYVYSTWEHNQKWYVTREENTSKHVQIMQTNDGWVPLISRDNTKVKTFDSIENLEKYLGILLL